MPESAFAFVLGTGRCGSTLVQEIIARHPDVGFLSNVEDRLPLPPALGRWNGSIYRRTPEWLTRKGRLRFAPSEGYRAPGPRGVAGRRDAGARSPGRGCFAVDDGGPPAFLRCPGRRARRATSSCTSSRGGRAPASCIASSPTPGSCTWSGTVARWRTRSSRCRGGAATKGPSAGAGARIPEAYGDEWRAVARLVRGPRGIQWKMLIDAFSETRSELPADQWLEISLRGRRRRPAGSHGGRSSDSSSSRGRRASRKGSAGTASAPNGPPRTATDLGIKEVGHWTRSWPAISPGSAIRDDMEVTNVLRARQDRAVRRSPRFSALVLTVVTVGAVLLPAGRRAPPSPTWGPWRGRPSPPRIPRASSTTT